MFAFILSAGFGVCQVLMTEQLIYAVNTRNSKRSAAFIAVKILLYALAIGLVTAEFVWHLSFIICGFVASIPVTALALFVLRTIYKK